MNKKLWLVIVVVAIVLISAGCGQSPAADTPVTEEPVNETPTGEGIATLGLGLITKINRSLDFDADAEILAMAQVDSVIAAATFNAEGRVIDVVIDTAQTRVNFDEELQVASDMAAEVSTKAELGDDYGMIKASEIGIEWHEQIAALEEWMVGKTAAEIKALSLTEQGAPADVDLAASVTITVTDYIAALEKAYNTAVPVVEGAASLGLGHKVSIARSVGYQMTGETEILPLGQVDVVIAAMVFDVEGRVAGGLIDTAQTRVNFDAEGQVSSDRAALYPTKVELGDDYGMSKASEIGVEWHEQIASLQEWMVGKTVEEIKAMQIKDGAPDEPDLVSTVTISVQDYIYAVAEAYSRAR